MKTSYKLAAAVALAAAAVYSTSASATAITCPDPMGPDDTRSYTVDPALSCVYGDGNINGNTNDEFLDLTQPFGLDWTLVGTNSTPGGAISGVTITLDLINPGQSATWTITDTSYSNYALGVKDGGTPKWAVFLLDGSSGTVSMTGGSFSHFGLYGSGTPNNRVPEPNVLGLLGLGLLATGFVRRRKI